MNENLLKLKEIIEKTQDFPFQEKYWTPESPDYIEGVLEYHRYLGRCLSPNSDLDESERAKARSFVVDVLMKFPEEEISEAFKRLQSLWSPEGKMKETIKKILNFLDIHNEDLENLSKIELYSLATIKQLPKSLLKDLKENYSTKTVKEQIQHIVESLKEGNYDESDFGGENLSKEEQERCRQEVIEHQIDTLRGDQEIFSKADQQKSTLENTLKRVRSFSKLAEEGQFPIEMLEFLVRSQIQGLWESLYYNTPKGTEEYLKDQIKGSIGTFQRKILEEFLSEYTKTRDLEVPSDWHFQVNGVPVEPTLMQKLTALKVKENRQFGNWSETGTGKTLSAILSSRVIGAKTTLIIAVNATITGWESQISEGFKNSRIYTKDMITENMILSRDQKFNYILVNFEEFQKNPKVYLGKWKKFFALNPIDFVVIDETQKVKIGFSQREEENQVTLRRKTIETLLNDIDILTYGKHNNDSGRKVPMLVMSATPVINDVVEGESIITLLTGIEYVRSKRLSLRDNAYNLHYKICKYGIRIEETPAASTKLVQFEISKSVPKEILDSEKSTSLFQQLQNYNGSADISLAKLKECKKRGYLVKGVPTIIYTELVNKGVILRLTKYLKDNKFTVGEFTGRNTGYDREDDYGKFCGGEYDVLLASSPIGTGVDGLQSICNRIIMLNAPWTYAGYHQLEGRLNRKGASSDVVEVIWPKVVYGKGKESISPDLLKIYRIKYKNSISDAVMMGELPEDVISTEEIKKMAKKKLLELQEMEKAGKTF